MTWSRELGRCPDCGGAIVAAGPVGSGRMRRTCLRTCRLAPQDERITPVDRSPAHAKRIAAGPHRLGRAALVLHETRLERDDL